MQYELPGCQVRSNCRSGGHSIHGEPCSPRNNDIPIVRYWAQAPDGSPTEHCIAAALDLLRACRRAFQCQAGKGPWAAGGCRRGMGISRECHRSRTPASAASASHDLWDCREGTRSPATATSPCGQPALASADRRTSHDGIVRAASTRLPGCPGCQALPVACIACTCTVAFSRPPPPGQFFQNARDVTFCPLVCFGFLFASLLSRGFSSLGTRALPLHFSCASAASQGARGGCQWL